MVSKRGQQPHARGAGLLARSAISLDNKTCWQETQWRRLPLQRPTASSAAADGRDFSAVDSPGNTDVAMDDGKDGESE